jgi:cysteine desulfurase
MKDAIANASDDPLTGQRVYLDHAASTPTRPEVRLAVAAALEAYPGNPSSLHREGREARAALERARGAIRAALGASSFRLLFSSGGTESDNAAILGALLGAARSRGSGLHGLHLVTTAVEHSAVLGAVDSARRLGAQATVVGVDADARIDPGDVLRALRPDTVLVSVQAVNNEVGTVQPCRELGRALRERGIALHVDAVQLLGKDLLDAQSLGADLVSLSAHKIGGPKGVGALLVHESVALDPFVRGGGQEEGLRAGTEDLAGAIGFARAVELASDELPDASVRMRALRTRLEEGLSGHLQGVYVLTPKLNSAPHILSLRFDEVDGEALLMRLDHMGVAVSTGSACRAATRTPSHVLQAMGLKDSERRGSLRVSVGLRTRAEEIEAAIVRIIGAVGALRALAPARR